MTIASMEETSGTRQQQLPLRFKFSACSCLALVLNLMTHSSALQFELDAGRTHCFQEEIPPNTPVLVSCTVVAGSGDFPVSLQVGHVSTATIITARHRIDKDKFTFRTPDSAGTAGHDPNRQQPASNMNRYARNSHQAIPHTVNSGTGDAWHMKNDDDTSGFDANAARKVQVAAEDRDGDFFLGGSGDDARDLYSFCFGKSSSDGSGSFHILPRMSMGTHGSSDLRRRVLFNVQLGADAQNVDIYETLAKEQHLLKNEEIFAVINNQMTDISHRIDEMKAKVGYMDQMNARTSRIVLVWSLLACTVIVVVSVLQSHATKLTFQHHKLI